MNKFQELLGTKKEYAKIEKRSYIFIIFSAFKS